MKRLLAVLLGVSIAVSAAATTIRRYSLIEVRDRAETVFVGVAGKSSTRIVADGMVVVTDYTVAVQEVLAGSVGRSTTVTFPGGKHGEKETTIAGAPTLEQGKTYVFFRTRQPNNTTVGWGQGLFQLETAKVDGATRTLLVTNEGVPLVRDQGVLALGTPVEVRDDRFVRVVTNAAAAPLTGHVRGVATNADGSPARHVTAAPVQASANEIYATLDDLRKFVRAGARQ